MAQHYYHLLMKVGFAECFRTRVHHLLTRACENGHVHVLSWLYHVSEPKPPQITQAAFFSACRNGPRCAAQWLARIPGLVQYVTSGPFAASPLKGACKGGDLRLCQWLLAQSIGDQTTFNAMATLDVDHLRVPQSCAVLSKFMFSDELLYVTVWKACAAGRLVHLQWLLTATGFSTGVCKTIAKYCLAYEKGFVVAKWWVRLFRGSGQCDAWLVHHAFDAAAKQGRLRMARWLLASHSNPDAAPWRATHLQRIQQWSELRGVWIEAVLAHANAPCVFQGPRYP